MATMQKDTDGKWKYSNTVVTKDGLESTLKTAGKYLDADIKLDVDVNQGEVEEAPEVELALEAGDGIVTISTPGLATSETETEFAIHGEGSGLVSATANGSVDITKSGWLDTQTIDLAEATQTLESNTANKTVYLAAAEFTTSDDEASVTTEVETTGFSKSETPTPYVVTAKGAGTYSAKATVTEGYTKGDEKTISGDVDVTEASIYIKEGAVAETVNPDEKSATVEATITPTGFAFSESATNYKIDVKSTAAFASKVKATEGYIEDKTIDVEGEASKDEDTLYIAAASLANSAVDPDAYTTVAGPVLVSGSYLFIDGGIIEKQKIALKDLVPDGSNVKGKENLVYKDVSVYDNDGVLVAGTMGDAAVSFTDSTVTLVGAVSEDGATYDVTSDASSAEATVAGGYLAPDTEVVANIKATKYSIPVFQGDWE